MRRGNRLSKFFQEILHRILAQTYLYWICTFSFGGFLVRTLSTGKFKVGDDSESDVELVDLVDSESEQMVEVGFFNEFWWRT